MTRQTLLATAHDGTFEPVFRDAQKFVSAGLAIYDNATWASTALQDHLDSVVLYLAMLAAYTYPLVKI